MALASSDFSFLEATTMGADLTTSNIGGAIGATAITGGSIGEVLFMMPSPTSGSTTQYQKTFLKNTHATLTATSVGCWLPNALDDVASNGVPSCVSTSATDSSSNYVRFMGFDASGAAQQEQVTLNGTSAQSGVLTFSALHRAEKRAVSGDALVAAVGDITIKVNAVTLGVIPLPDSQNSYYSATGEIKIGLEASLDGSTTTTNPATAPGGVSFTKPRTSGTSLAFASAGSLAPATAQAIWWKWVLAANAKPSADADAAIMFSAVTT